MLNIAEKRIRKIYESINLSDPEQLYHAELIEDIVSSLDISVYYIDEKSEANNLGGRYRIFLNQNQSKQKIWQDFGHELGHICTHEGDQRFMPIRFRNYQESHADNFAYHFCIPTFMLNQIELPQMQREAAGLIADIFNVEGEFAHRRLSKWLMHRQQWKGVINM